GPPKPWRRLVSRATGSPERPALHWLSRTRGAHSENGDEHETGTMRPHSSLPLTLPWTPRFSGLAAERHRRQRERRNEGSGGGSDAPDPTPTPPGPRGRTRARRPASARRTPVARVGS